MFKVGDEVHLSPKGVETYSGNNWSGYEVPLAVYIKGGTITGIDNEGLDCDLQIYVEPIGGGPAVWFEEDDLVLANKPAIREDEESSALDKQVSGNHYKGCKIQPIEYIHANGLDYFQGNVVKYVTRHKDKNGKADIEKAIHYLELILELQYGE